VSARTLTCTDARRPPASARARARGPPRRQVRERVQRCERLCLIAVDIIAMLAEYIQAAMDKATYEIIDDPEPFYGEVPELQGVWAAGKTLEECHREFERSHRGLDCIEAEIWSSNTCPSAGILLIHQQSCCPIVENNRIDMDSCLICSHLRSPQL